MAPLLLKIAPDLDDPSLADITEVAIKSAALDGLIISNTTLSRAGLKSRHAGEVGGLSGRPLFERSTRILARIHRLTDGKLPLIGVGGIASPADAWSKIRAGASLLQLYSALVYQGPELSVPSISASSSGSTSTACPTLPQRSAPASTSGSREPTRFQRIRLRCMKSSSHWKKPDCAGSTPRKCRSAASRRDLAYVDPHGRTVTHRPTRRRITDLVIPPAWSEVRIAADPQAHLQAVGRDEAGRLQYIYHEAWEDVRAQAKALRLKRLGIVLPDLRQRVVTAIAAAELTRESVIATAIRLIDIAVLRVGHEMYAGEESGRGVATLLKRHVRFNDSTIRLSFRASAASASTRSLDDPAPDRHRAAAAGARPAAVSRSDRPCQTFDRQ